MIDIPPIIRIVLTQATRHWMRGQISFARFRAQVQRLSREELATRGLALRSDKSAGGGKRWIIEVAKSGKVLETIEIAAGPFERELQKCIPGTHRAATEGAVCGAGRQI